MLTMDVNIMNSDVDMIHEEHYGNINDMNMEDISAGLLKVRKHRRGKKLRKGRPYDNKDMEGDQLFHITTPDSDGKTTDRTVQLQRGGGLRPRYSPQAPRNYTQYIIDDQERAGDGSTVSDEVQLETFLASQFEVELKQHQEAELEAKSQTELRTLVSHLRNQVSALESRLILCSSCKSSHFDSVSSSSDISSSDDSENIDDIEGDDSFKTHSNEGDNEIFVDAHFITLASPHEDSL